LLQVVTLLAMEPPVAADAGALRDERAKVLRAMRPLDPAEVVRGQYRTYKDEEGVDPHSEVDTFVALRLEIDSWRWAGVPFLVRAGKCMTKTATVCLVRFQAPPRLLFAKSGDTRPEANSLVFRLGGDEGVTFRLQAKAPGEDLSPRPVDLDVSFDKVFGERQEAYERLLDDAMDGDPRRFARADSVEEAWRVVQPVLDQPSPLQLYESGTWGPWEAEALAADYGGWHDPA
ncbi:MAG: glucose-6-phosphate dehydrogenase, partial [Actinomycetota bacterium]|nr:glucose-6-phosphate dehydrogenase [Actinomycetota bacterium]